MGTPRKPANLSLDADLVREARALEVNLSRAAEDGIRRAVRAAGAARWQRENRTALDASNAYVDDHGLPLAGSRLF